MVFSGQLEMAEKHKTKKSNKVFPGVAKEGNDLVNGDLFNGSSMTVRALTSPPRRIAGQTDDSTGATRPFSSKSLGNNEGMLCSFHQSRWPCSPPVRIAVVVLRLD